MYCRRCGSHNPDTATVCQSCSAQLTAANRLAGSDEIRLGTLGPKKTGGSDSAQVVWLHAPGKNKVKLIHEITRLTGMSNAEAYEMIQGAPCILKTVSNVKAAEEVRDALHALGAIVRIVPRSQHNARAISRSVAAEARRAAAAAGPNHKVEDRAELKGDFKITLKSPGSMKIGVTNRVMQFTRLSLKDASALVDQAPCTIIAGVSRVRAEEMVASFEKIGAEVVVEQETD